MSESIRQEDAINTKMNTKRLADSIKDRPVIWDSSYPNRKLKSRIDAWDEVKELNPPFTRKLAYYPIIMLQVTCYDVSTSAYV